MISFYLNLGESPLSTIGRLFLERYFQRGHLLEILLFFVLLPMSVHLYMSNTLAKKSGHFQHCLPPWPFNLFKTAKLPKNAKILIFHGHPDPDEARDGKWSLEGKASWKKIYKYTRPTPWIEEYWRE